MPSFVKSTSLVSKSVIRRYNRVNFNVKVNLGQSSCYFDLVKFSTWPSNVKKYMFRCVLKSKTRWCLHYFAIFLSLNVICKKQHILNSLSFLLWPDLEGSRYYLKRSNRVRLDWEGPKNLFGIRPTVLSQLGAKWHGGVAPHPRHVRSKMGKWHVRARGEPIYHIIVMHRCFIVHAKPCAITQWSFNLFDFPEEWSNTK